MRTVTLQQAEAELSQLIDAALKGEEIMIAREGKPVAQLMPTQEKALQETVQERKPGALKGRIIIAEDF